MALSPITISTTGPREKVRKTKLSASAACSSFSSKVGAEEVFLSLESEAGADFGAAVTHIESSYREAMSNRGLSVATCAFARIFLSDIENQKKVLAESGLFRLMENCAVSVVGEPCLSGGPIGLFAYHVDNGRNPVRTTVCSSGNDGWRRSVLVSGDHYAMLWNTNCDDQGPFDAHAQTDAIFGSLDDEIRKNGMTLLGNSIRSWVYIRDIDNHYKGMVQSRKAFFERNNLTDRTRYLASTGIEGESRHVNSLVSVDLLSFSNLQPEQIVRMEALDNMSPTIRYGVTFERGLRVRFGDRSHLYVSGTASIDMKGEVLFPGDVRRQTARTLENVSALLANQGADLNDLAYMFVYIRDLAAAKPVREVIKRILPPGLPVIVVQGSVCRPSWLMEVEGVAIIGEENPFPPFM